ncbi:hypothetical protein QJS66_13925 [Kocuria rhizophila]|nr:hypothetical protein QJS66_13925 [Kocuria rhizophila]
MLVIAAIAVFVAGLLVGAPPSTWARDRPAQMKLASLYILARCRAGARRVGLSFGIPALRTASRTSPDQHRPPRALRGALRVRVRVTTTARRSWASPRYPRGRPPAIGVAMLSAGSS